jgi:hypothetical protein
VRPRERKGERQYGEDGEGRGGVAMDSTVKTEKAEEVWPWTRRQSGLTRK